MPPVIKTMSPQTPSQQTEKYIPPMHSEIQAHAGGHLVRSKIFDRHQGDQVSMPRIDTGDAETDNLLQYLYRRSVNNDRSLSKELDKYIKLFTKKKSAQTFYEEHREFLITVFNADKESITVQNSKLLNHGYGFHGSNLERILKLAELLKLEAEYEKDKREYEKLEEMVYAKNASQLQKEIEGNQIQNAAYNIAKGLASLLSVVTLANFLRRRIRDVYQGLQGNDNDGEVAIVVHGNNAQQVQQQQVQPHVQQQQQVQPPVNVRPRATGAVQVDAEYRRMKQESK